MKYLISIIAAAVLTLGVIVYAVHTQQQAQAPAQSFGAVQPFAGSTYNLAGSGLSSSATSIVLTNLTIKQTGQPIQTTDLVGSGGTFYVTIEPGNNTKQEIVGCTGVTQASNSASLTGCTRGLAPIYPYTASTTLSFVHAGGSQVIFSDPPQLFQQFLALSNVSTSSAILIFGSTTPPRYDADPVWANFGTNILADVAYVNSVVAAGAANASETVKGIVQLATAAQAALGTSLGSTGARLGLPASLATSTPGLSTVTGDLPTATGRFIAQTWLDLTAAFTFSTSTSFIGNFGVLTATSSARLPANTTIGGLTPLTSVTVPHYSVSGGSLTAGSNSYATSSILSIPAGVATASSTFNVMIKGVCSTSTSDCQYFLKDVTGATTFAECNWGNDSVTNDLVYINMFGFNNSSLSAQQTLLSGWKNSQGTTNTLLDCSNNSTSAFNSANALNLVIVLHSTTGSNTVANIYLLTFNP